MIRTIPLVPHFFFFNDTATTEIYTLSLQRRSSDLILEDSPASYRGPQYTAMSLQARRMPERALEDYLIAFQIFDRDSRVLIGAADAAWTLHRSALADSLMEQARARCGRGEASLRNQAAAAPR